MYLDPKIKLYKACEIAYEICNISMPEKDVSTSVDSFNFVYTNFLGLWKNVLSWIFDYFVWPKSAYKPIVILEHWNSWFLSNDKIHKY